MGPQHPEPSAFVIIGGGIGGVCCVEELQRVCRPGDTVTLVSASAVLKGVGPITQLTRNLEDFDIVERSLESLATPNTRVVCGRVTHISTQAHSVTLHTGEVVPYTALCIATGARPKELSPSPAVFTVRDTDSVDALAGALSSPGVRRVLVVGNGGIALELVGLLQGMCGGLEVVWVMRHGHLGDSFFDTDAAQFLLQHTHAAMGRGQEQAAQPDIGKPQAYHVLSQKSHQPASQPAHMQTATQADSRTHDNGSGDGSQHEPLTVCRRQQLQEPAVQAVGTPGHAAGPAWTRLLATRMAGGMEGQAVHGPQGAPSLKDPNVLICEFSAEVVSVRSTSSDTNPSNENSTHITASTSAPPHDSDTWPAYVQLSNGREWGCDVVVAAVGVQPATDWLPASLIRAPDGGVLVDAALRCVSIPDGSVYAIGDSCTLQPGCCGPHYFQMRLWTQARSQGLHAARVMAGVVEEQYYGGTGIGMELFAHATHFLGFKVVLLGLYNGQGLQGEPEEDMRMYSRVLHGSRCPHSQSGSSRMGDEPRASGIEPQRGSVGAHGSEQQPAGPHGQDVTGDASIEGCSFVRILLLRGKLVGAVLIGDTDLEEVFENLILDRLDLSHCAHELLDPDIELDHVFD